MNEPREHILMDGANELTGPAALAWVVWHWPALRRELCSTPGYIAHRVWYAPPWTIGLTTWWRDARSAYTFAHRPIHLAFWRWAEHPARTRGGWLATYRYVRGGALWGNGVRAMTRRLGDLTDAPDGAPPRAAP